MTHDREDEDLAQQLDAAREEDSAHETALIPNVNYGLGGRWSDSGRRQRFDEAVARLDADVAAHEARKVDLVIENLSGEEVEYTVLGPPLGAFPDPDFTADGKMHGAAVGDEILPEPDAERFGARLRGAIGRDGLLRGWGFLAGDSLTPKQVAELDRIADAIDRDRDALQCERMADEHENGYRRALIEARQKVEQLVEELRYHTDYAGAGQNGGRDVLDAEPFLERLGRIFGERPEQVASPWTWSRVLGLVAAEAGWKVERFVREFGDDGFALERFLEAEGEEDEPSPPDGAEEVVDSIDPSEARASAESIDLMSALKESLAGTDVLRGRRRGRRKSEP